MKLIKKYLDKTSKMPWSLQNEYIIAIAVLIFSLALLMAYQGVIFSPADGTINTHLTFYSVAIFPIFCAARLFILHLRPYPYFGLVTGTIDILLLSTIIFMFSEQYGTAAATLKSPSFAFYFVLIAIHAMRFKPKLTLIHGALSVVAWSIIIFLVSYNNENISHYYLEYVTTHALLLGAEIEKLFALTIFTLALSMGAKRANNLHQKEKSSINRLDREKRLSRLKSEFLDTMNHELRTPMNGVLGMIQTLRMTPLNGKQNDMLRIMEVSGDSLVKLLNDILEFSRFVEGKLELNNEPMDIKTIINNNAAIAIKNSKAKNLQIFVEFHPTTPRHLIGDEHRLSKVLEHLLSNAVKFTHEGYIRFHINGTRQGGEAILNFEVHDTGIGMADKRLNDIFNPFHQLDGSKTRLYGGTGMGLALSQRIIHAMGSNIRVKSTKGIGSIFSFSLTLPIATSNETNLETLVNQKPVLNPTHNHEINSLKTIANKFQNHPVKSQTIK